MRDSEEILDAAAALVQRRTGLVLRSERRAAFRSALSNSIGSAGTRSALAYLDRLERDAATMDSLVAEVTVGETYFFREPQQFAVIRDLVIPELLARRAQGGPLRVWSAGCATGEEPYSLAIVLLERGLAGTAQVVATDLSRSALARARQARFSRWSLRGVSDDVVRSYFDRQGDRFVLSPAVRDTVEFRYLNLAEDAYPSATSGIWGMDMILCRNVLIYLDSATIATVARRLMDSLSNDGWLLLGASDPVLSDLVSCQVVVTDAGLAYRRSSSGPATQRTATLPAQTQMREPVSENVTTPALDRPEAGVSGVTTVGAVDDSPGPALEATRSTTELSVDRPTEERPVAERAEWERQYAARDYATAARSAGRAVLHDGGSPGAWVVLVRALANSGDLSAAGRACATGLDKHRTSAELTYLHAVLLAESRKDADAAAAARRALYLDRGLVVAHLLLAGVLARTGDKQGARRSLRNALRLLQALAPQDLVAAADAESAGRLAEMARTQLQLLEASAE